MLRCVLLLVLLPVCLAAQGPIPPQFVTWVQTGVTPPDAQLFIYNLTITEEGNPNPRTLSLLSVLCGGSEKASECSASLPIPSAQTAIITGNTSQLTAFDPATNRKSIPSLPFVGDQGCIFRSALYAVTQQAKQQTNKQGLTALLAEFQRAKFKHISTQDLKGNQFIVVEECAGFLVK